MHGSPPPTDGAPAVYAPPTPPLQLLPRQPSPNLERITTMATPNQAEEEGQGFTGCRKTHDCVDPPWKSGPSGPGKACKNPRGLRPWWSFFLGRLHSPQPFPTHDTFGYNIWCFSLDRHNGREYFKHPRVFRISFFLKEATAQISGGDSKLP
jgi:hypothetical protein